MRVRDVRGGGEVRKERIVKEGWEVKVRDCRVGREVGRGLGMG